MTANEAPAVPAGFWDEHREAELDRWLEATPTQRLVWLDSALRLAHATGALPKPPPDVHRP